MHASSRSRQHQQQQQKARARPFSPQISSSSMHKAPPSPPAYKVAKLVRGQQGFGFTISGQAPCILSCVVANSSADRAGLHAGDCLLAVNGCDVSRAPHDEVVRLVGSCMGTLRLHLAESGIPPTGTSGGGSAVAAAVANGYSSSDEDAHIKLRVLPASAGKTRPARNRHPNRVKRKGATPPHRAERVVRDLQSGLIAATSSPRSSMVPQIKHHHHTAHSSGTGSKQRRRRNSSDDSHEHLANLIPSPRLHARLTKQQQCSGQLLANGVGTTAATSGQLMYRSVVGYLGTIEMPEESSSSSQSSPSSGISGGAISANGGPSNNNNSAAARLAAIRSCVRRLRVEKKVHTLVLLRVWGPRPSTAGAATASSSGKITLTSPAGANLARFPARRVVFCGAYADDVRFFGLVTSASTNATASDTTDEEDIDEEDNNNDGRGGCSTSESRGKMLNTRRKNPAVAAAASGFTSCHVFMVDSRLVAHEGHAARAHAFRFQCTADAAGDGRACLEFPPTAEPILQAVLSLCASSGCHGNNSIGSGLMGWASPLLQQQQPQQQHRHHHHHQQHQQRLHNLSSHSSNSSSNSDSGIFRDRDDGKCSDRDIQLRHQLLEQQQQQQQPANLDRLTVRAMPSPSSVKSPGEVEHAARLRSSMQRYLSQQQQPQANMLLLNRNTGTHQHVNPSLSVRATMTLEEKLSPQVYKGRPAGGGVGLPHHHQPTSNRPTRTPSERSRARSLDDLSKSSQADEPKENHHHPHHHHHPQLGSDNGLDKIDWEAAPYTRPRLVPKSLHWPTTSTERPSSSSQTMSGGSSSARDDDRRIQHDDNEVLHSTPPPPPPPPPISSGCDDHRHIEEIITTAAAAAAAAASNQTVEKSLPTQQQQQQYIWTQGFEKLLEDPLGLRAFAEFLKKEFSHENIYFWAACERFHRLFPTDDAAIAATEAHKIFERHLGPTAGEPVNVDSQARQTAEENLSHPGPELFDQAQKQVFNLMKYDCYPRFLRSTIYRQCVEALKNQQTPPIGEATLHDPDLNIDWETHGEGDGDSVDRSLAALKKSGSDAGERRRRSLLPWPKKDRSKSKDRGELDYRKTNKKKHRIGSTSSAASGDKEKDNTDDEDHQQSLQQQMKRAASRDSVTSEFSDRAFHIQSSSSSVPLVKVLLPDLSSAVIAARPGQSVQQLLNKLLERRGLRFNAFELYDQNTSNAVELERDASILAGLEIRLEPRVVFHLLLASSGKSLMIRGQPRRQLGEVLKPILIKYGLKMDHSVIVKSATGDVVQPKTLLTTLDGLHLKVTSRDADESQLTLEDPIGPVKSQEADTEVPPKSSLMGRRGLTRRNSLQSERSRTVSAKKHNSATAVTSSQTISEDQDSTAIAAANNKRLSLHELSKSSDNTSSSASNLMPPPRVPPSGQRKATSQRNPLSRLENEALYEHLKRAQRCRLEDQRGTEINFELPDFLKLPGRCSVDGYSESCELPLDGRASEPIRGCRPRLVYQESYEFPLDGRVSEPIFCRRDASETRINGSVLSGPTCASPDFAAIAAQILDRSFTSDGLMPTHDQAEQYFGSSNASLDLKPNSQPMLNRDKITVAAAKQNVATVAARIAAIEQNDRMKRADRQMAKSNSNSNWDDLLLDLDVDWRCYQQGRETDDQKQQLQQHNRPRTTNTNFDATSLTAQQQQQTQMNNRPPLPNPPALELLDLDDPLIASSSQPALPPPPPLPPKPGKIKISDAMKATNPQQPMPPPRPPSRNVNTTSRVNVSFV